MPWLSPPPHPRLTLAPHLRTPYKSFPELEVALLPVRTQPGGRQMPPLPVAHTFTLSPQLQLRAQPALGGLQGAGRESSCPLPTRSTTPAASSPPGHAGTPGSSASDGGTKAKCKGGSSRSHRAPGLRVSPSGSKAGGHSFIHSLTRSLICSFHPPPHHSGSNLLWLRPHLGIILDSFLLPPLPPHPTICKFCWFYLQNTTQILPSHHLHCLQPRPSLEMRQPPHWDPCVHAAPL